jgi:hypothetical protein
VAAPAAAAVAALDRELAQLLPIGAAAGAELRRIVHGGHPVKGEPECTRL